MSIRPASTRSRPLRSTRCQPGCTDNGQTRREPGTQSQRSSGADADGSAAQAPPADGDAMQGLTRSCRRASPRPCVKALGVTRRRSPGAVTASRQAADHARSAIRSSTPLGARTRCSRSRFSSTHDSNWYTLMPGENADSFGGTGWTLSGGAEHHHDNAGGRVGRHGSKPARAVDGGEPDDVRDVGVSRGAPRCGTSKGQKGVFFYVWLRRARTRGRTRGTPARCTETRPLGRWRTQSTSSRATAGLAAGSVHRAKPGARRATSSSTTSTSTRTASSGSRRVQGRSAAQRSAAASRLHDARASFLPGFSSPLGSNVRLIASCIATAAGCHCAAI